MHGLLRRNSLVGVHDQETTQLSTAKEKEVGGREGGREGGRKGWREREKLVIIVYNLVGGYKALI